MFLYGKYEYNTRILQKLFVYNKHFRHRIVCHTRHSIH